jgi:hypothetical protein
MGEGTTRIDDTSIARNNGRTLAAPEEATKALEAEIAVVREELGELVAEMDRRRHEALDIRRHLRRHAVEITLTAIGLVGAATGFVWLGMWRARRRERLTSQADRLRRAMTRMIDRPERVAAEPTVPAKIVTAAANAAVATLIKKALDRAVQHAMDSGRDHSARRDVVEATRPDAAA